ncbi:MAG TPA: type II toxin-antitoxin system death-on-curing family toxin [Pyrinomonadaceae bacterium]|nr:type II toxin-antitoxin system death-on-curing family toxin [Pyrinomonadaceae bacterium]
MNEPVWIILESVYSIHTAQIAEHGGSDGIRDEGLLLSALARPQNVFAYNDDADHASLAAAYAFGIAKNHPFIDGNKRTALVVMRTFLALNDLNFNATPEAKFTTILRLAEGGLTEEGLAEWIRSCVS